MIDVSVVTVCRNAAATISETIASVRRQTGVSVEHIIIDGASNDDTMRIVRAEAAGAAQVISEPDHGLYDAMNKGLKVARGRLIGYLNADDALAKPDVLQRLVKAHRRHDVQAVYGDVLQINGRGWPARLIKGKAFAPARFRQGLMPPHPAFYAEPDVLRRAGGFDLAYANAADFDLLLRVFNLPGFRAVYEPGIVTHMRLGGVSTRGLTSTRAANHEILRSCRAHGVDATIMTLLSRYPLKLREVVAGRLLHLTSRKKPG